MIVLDTNIISELMKKHPADNVISWLNLQDVNKLFITAITIAEISYGISILPIGNRRSVIEDEFNKAINGSFNSIIKFLFANPWKWAKLHSLNT